MADRGAWDLVPTIGTRPWSGKVPGTGFRQMTPDNGRPRCLGLSYVDVDVDEDVDVDVDIDVYVYVYAYVYVDVDVDVWV